VGSVASHTKINHSYGMAVELEDDFSLEKTLLVNDEY